MSTSFFSPPSASESRQVQSIVYVAADEYRTIEVGEVDIPGGAWREDIDDIDPGLAVWALNFEISRTSGSGSFTSDAIVLVPSEHILTWRDAVVRADNLETANMITFENDEVVGYSIDNLPDRLVETASIGTRNWSYPINGGHVVFVAQDQNGHDRTDTVNPSISVYKRWLTYHG
jgi:hypothetical protein